jgi:hypothetical protein
MQATASAQLKCCKKGYEVEVREMLISGDGHHGMMAQD